MPSYYEALPIYKVGAGYTVAVALEELESCGKVRWRRLACIFERPLAGEPEQEKPK